MSKSAFLLLALLIGLPVALLIGLPAWGQTPPVHHRHRRHHHAPAPRVAAAAPRPDPSAPTPAPVPNEDKAPPEDTPPPETPSLHPGNLQLHYPAFGEGYVPGSSPQAMDDDHAATVPGVTVRIPLNQAPPPAVPSPR